MVWRSLVRLLVSGLAVELLWRWSTSVQVAGVVGGQDAEPHEFPHMGLVGHPGNDGQFAWFCGASLITNRYALTVAHCVSRGSLVSPSFKVRFGEHDFNATERHHEDVGIDRIVLHPEYNGVQVYHDIALLRLSRIVRFSAFVRPACLWTQDTVPQDQLVATGWGHLGHFYDQATVLQKVQIPIVPNDQCNRILYHDRRLRKGVAASQICAGDMTNGGKDTCLGDSGGPLQAVSTAPNVCLYSIVGVTSSGGICGSAKRPSVYVRVSYYLEWIQSVVGSRSLRLLPIRTENSS